MIGDGPTDVAAERVAPTEQAATGRNAVAWMLLAELVVLFTTGIALYFRYRPAAAPSWGGIVQETASRSDTTREIHRVASVAFPVTAAVGVALHLAARQRLRVTGVLLVALGVAGIGTGFVLPWDQLALWAVTVGENHSGYTWLFDDDQVRFVLVDGREVGLPTLRRWFVLHLAVGAVALGIALVAARRGRAVGQATAEAQLKS